jgi:MYXO-CTERM domain-containing protein
MDLFGGKKDTENLSWATSELVEVVQPRFLVHAGDLVDGTGGGLIPVGQFEEEWQAYRAILDGNGMSPDFYFDLPGNHDAYGDPDLPHYLQYSIQGEATGELNHAWTVEDAGSKFLFVGLATSGTDGAFWPADNGGLDGTDQAFFQSAIAAHPDADILCIFGHHPASDNYISDGLGMLLDTMVSSGASLYAYGHTHDHSMKWKAGALQLNVASLGKSDDLQVGLIAFDGRGLSAKAFGVGRWPVVLVTAPTDVELGGDHKAAYMVDGSLPAAPVRALVFSPGPVDQVSATLDQSIPVPMSEVKPNVWQGAFDATLLDPYPHTLQVLATAGTEADSDSVVFYVKPPEPLPDPDVQDLVSQGDQTAADIPLQDLPEATDDPGDGGGAEAGETGDGGGAEAGGETGDGGGAEAGGETGFGTGPETGDAGAVTGYIPAEKSGGCNSAAGNGPGGLPVLAVVGLWMLLRLRRRDKATYCIS